MTSAVQVPVSDLGPLIQTYASGSTFPKMAHAYREVSQEAKEAGLLQRTPWFYGLVGAAIVAAFAGLLTGFILLGDSWFQLLIAAGLGIALTQLSFVTHEAAHRQVLAKSSSNTRLGRLLAGAVGLSYSWWDSKHTRHHSNPNQIGKDPDIEIDTISFLQEDAAKSRGIVRAITKRQGWLFFPLLTFEGLNLHYQSIKYLCTTPGVKARWYELGLIVARFALYLVPLFMFLPVGMAFAFLGVQMAVFGIYMGAAFAPNHKGMPVFDRTARVDFFTKQVRTSRNISGGWWATWLMGGLNYQVEHHLFPNMARPKLAQARKIVMEYCRTNDVPYTETTLIKSYGIVIRYLNRVGLAARDPFECPIMAEYRRG